MKYIITNRKGGFLGFLFTGVMLIISGELWAQPTVNVPAVCNVVVAGVGGTTGFGGVVGNGGIVTMPDPYIGGTFTINPNGNTTNGWYLLGDLSIAPNVNPYGDPIVSAIGGSADIMSYNKDVRQSEQSVNPNLARSIGQVRIPYDDTLNGCSNSIYFKVYKVYSNPIPNIVGPDCWLTDSTYTYSVDQIASDNLPDGIGLDSYYWTITDSNGDTIVNQVYTSADKSSVTIVAPGTLNAPYTIQCCFGRANPWDGDVSGAMHTTCITTVVGASPSPPVLSSPGCLDVTATSFAVGVTPYVPGYTYEWSSNNPQWLITPNAGGATVSGIGYNGGILSLEVKNGGCSSVTVTDTIRRSFSTPLVSIVGDTCVNDSTTHNYQIYPVGVQGNQTCWNLPVGWTANALNNTESNLDITIPNGTPGGVYTLEAYSCECPSDTIQFTVRVRPDDPTIVAGSTCINHGATGNLTYTVSPPGNYQWTLPPGWTGSSSTETIVVTPSGVTIGAITATGVDTSGMGCNSVNSAIWNINFNPIDPDTATVGCFNVGIDGTTSVVINNAPSPFTGSYTVSSTPSDLLLSYSVNPSTGQITLNTSGAASSTNYTLHIAHQTPCGTSSTLNVPVSLGSGSSLLLVPLPSSDLYYINPAVPGASSYTWFLDGVQNANTAPTLSLYGTSTPPDSVCVRVMDTNGCTTNLCTGGGSYSAMILGGNNDIGITSNDKIRLYPNPNSGQFSVEIGKRIEQSADFQIIDMKGAVVAQGSLKQGTNQISEKRIQEGTYVILITVDNRTYAEKVQVLK